MSPSPLELSNNMAQLLMGVLAERQSRFAMVVCSTKYIPQNFKETMEILSIK